MKLITVGISEKTGCIIIWSNFDYCEPFEEKGWYVFFSNRLQFDRCRSSIYGQYCYRINESYRIYVLSETELLFIIDLQDKY